MSFLKRLWVFIGVILTLLGMSPSVTAQGFGLSVSTSAGSTILVSNSLSYIINVTNLTGISLQNTMVTNLLPATVQLLDATNSAGSTFTNYGSVAVFNLPIFSVGQIATLGLLVQPTVAGLFTNTITVTTFGLTNTASTNIVTLATNLVIQTDLGVTLTGSAQPVITNDWMTYGVTAFNLGSNAVANIMLTNTLPAGVFLKGVYPTNSTYSIASNNLVFNLGTLTNGGSTNLQFTVQPTNAAVLTFSAAIGAANVVDTNPTNNFASTNITVLSYPVGLLIAVTNSSQTNNPQNGLGEQSILLTNAGTNDVPAARVVVTGLTRQLFNAVGTNNGNPFVTLGAPLAVGKSVNLLLQYNPRGAFTFTNGQLHAFAVPLPNWAPPVSTTTSTNLNLNQIVRLANGNILIEWSALTNRTYTVVYSDNILFSNALIAPPAIVAPANETQWIDYGPPATISAPTNASARFYRVFLNP